MESDTFTSSRTYKCIYSRHVLSMANINPEIYVEERDDQIGISFKGKKQAVREAEGVSQILEPGEKVLTFSSGATRAIDSASRIKTILKRKGHEVYGPVRNDRLRELDLGFSHNGDHDQRSFMFRHPYEDKEAHSETFGSYTEEFGGTEQYAGEADPGRPEGMILPDYHRRLCSENEKPGLDDYTVGGESQRDVGSRTGEFFDEFIRSLVMDEFSPEVISLKATREAAKPSEFGTFVVITHEIAMKSTVNYLRGGPAQKFTDLIAVKNADPFLIEITLDKATCAAIIEDFKAGKGTWTQLAVSYGCIKEHGYFLQQSQCLAR